MSLFQALYFLGSDPKPFHIEDIDAASQADTVAEAYRLVVEQIPVGVFEGQNHTTYLPFRATHSSVMDCDCTETKRALEMKKRVALL